MNTRLLIRADRHYCNDVIKSILLTSPMILTTTSALSTDSYLHKMLFSPSDSLLKAEAKGYIMIYDGLDSTTVDRVMDEQFSRIDSMMFVRIQHLQDNGDYLVEDDGCD